MWAVIDIGSNTIRLVIYALESGQPRPMLNKKYAAGLAGYVDGSNRISPEGIEVLLEALTDIEGILRYIRPQRVLPFGTASLRNSANGTEIVDRIREVCGWDVRILTGEEEAVFDYYGARRSGIGDSGLLVDVGGGSTELTFFQNRQVAAATSIPLGSLNLYKKWVDGLLPTHKEAQRIKKEVNRYLREIPLPAEGLTAQPIVGVGGTARALLKLMKQQGVLGESAAYTRRQLKNLFAELGTDPQKLVYSILRACPDRVHTLLPGTLVFLSVSKYFGADRFLTSPYGVREGYLLHCLAEEGQDV